MGGSLVAVVGKKDIKPQTEDVVHYAIMLHDLSYHIGAVSRTLHGAVAVSTNDISKQEESLLEEIHDWWILGAPRFRKGKREYRNLL